MYLGISLFYYISKDNFINFYIILLPFKVMLMENLKATGYKMVDKRFGLDLTHTKMVFDQVRLFSCNFRQKLYMNEIFSFQCFMLFHTIIFVPILEVWTPFLLTSHILSTKMDGLNIQQKNLDSRSR